MNIRLADGSAMELEAGATALDAAKKISPKLAKAALAASIDGRTADLTAPLPEGCELKILTFEDDEGRRALRHTASHIMAQAVKRIWPEAKLAIGPAIDNGFYYDFDTEHTFTAEELLKVEKEMSRIVKENLPLERFTMSRAEALAYMKERGEDYKVELIEDLPEDAELSFYRQGDFTDLCAGAHVPGTGKVRAFKLTSSAGAYWRGDEKNKMLRRIYGTAFEDRAEMEAYLKAAAEALERDHNKLGRELKYFTTTPVIGQGLPLLMPKGSAVLKTLMRFVEDEEERRGYQYVRTPIMAKSDLYKISGHWDHYQDGMFILGKEGEDDEVLALRPMDCPFQFMIYKADHHSYRDLPVRFSETATLFRNEASGEMHGLIRVRQFTLSDGHIVCTPEQVEQEFRACIELNKYFMKCLGIANDVSYRFSRWDPANSDKYIDMPEEWERTEALMKRILDHAGVNYVEARNEAAFYGPKLDIQFKNVFGKEDTLFTIQIDFALATRFEMFYIDSDNQKKTPYIIHRASIGCYERTLAMMIEKYAGALPVWMAPEQARIMTINEEFAPYAQKKAEQLRAAGLRVKVDDRAEKIGYKIREARAERIPYMLVVGEKEAASDSFAVRKRGEGELGMMGAGDALNMILDEISEQTKY